MNKSITPLGHAIRAITMEHARSTTKQAGHHALACAALAAAVLSPPSFSLAATETVDGIEWNYNVEDGEATIGARSIWDCAIPTSTKGAITIPSRLGGYPVASIGVYAFSKCSGLTAVTIPASVTNIGDAVFSWCSKLETVFLQKGYSGNKDQFPSDAKIVWQ